MASARRGETRSTTARGSERRNDLCHGVDGEKGQQRVDGVAIAQRRVREVVRDRKYDNAKGYRKGLQWTSSQGQDHAGGRKRREQDAKVDFRPTEMKHSHPLVLARIVDRRPG